MLENLGISITNSFANYRLEMLVNKSVDTISLYNRTTFQNVKALYHLSTFDMGTSVLKGTSLNLH